MNRFPTDEVERTRRPAARLALTFGVVTTLVAALTALGADKLAAPPLTHPDELYSWASSLGIAAAALSIARLVALAAGWYFALTTLLHLVAALVHVPVLSYAAKLVTLPPIRRTLMTIAGLGLTAAAPAYATPSARRPPPRAASISADVAAQPGALMRRLSTSPGAVMHRLENGDGTATLRVLLPEEPDSATLHVVPSAPVRPPHPVTTGVWTVQAGDDFWHIATSTLTQRWKRAPSAAETDPYWRQLIDSNRALLADPSNPDLLFPGQVLSVPAPPSPQS